MQVLYTYIIVDDNPTTHSVIQNILKDCEGLVCTSTFTCLSDAVCYMKSVKVDFLFLDLELPDMNGLEIFDLTSDLPTIILITGYMDQFSKNICSKIHKGITACVEKPINPAELINLMTNLCKKTLV